MIKSMCYCPVGSSACVTVLLVTVLTKSMCYCPVGSSADSREALLVLHAHPALPGILLPGLPATLRGRLRPAGTGGPGVCRGRRHWGEGHRSAHCPWVCVCVCVRACGKWITNCGNKGISRCYFLHSYFNNTWLLHMNCGPQHKIDTDNRVCRNDPFFLFSPRIKQYMISNWG